MVIAILKNKMMYRVASLLIRVLRVCMSVCVYQLEISWYVRLSVCSL